MANRVYMSKSDPRFVSYNYYLAVVRLRAMNWKYAFATLIVLIGHDFAYSQQIPSTTTAAELWNPWTWFWPYAIASAEGFRDYYEKAQKATNELYQQAYKTNAFPWITGNWGGNPSQGDNSGQQGGQENQGGTGGQANQGGNSGQQGGQENQGGNSGQQGGQANQGGNSGQQGGQENQGGNSGQQGGQENQGGTGGQANPEENGKNQTENPVEENQTGNSETGAQVEGNVNDNGAGNAQISGNV